MAEWTIALVLKTSRLETVSEVRILSPPFCYYKVPSPRLVGLGPRIPPPPHMENKNKKTNLQEFEWKDKEFSVKEKNKSWFIIPGLITIAFGIFALASESFLFLVTIVLGFFVFYIYANKKPRIIKFRIDERGVEIDGRLYEFDSLSSFWIFYNPPEQKEISLRSKRTFLPYIKISLGKENPNEIRKFLLKFIPEKRHSESIIDILMRRIGF